MTSNSNNNHGDLVPKKNNTSQTSPSSKGKEVAKNAAIGASIAGGTAATAVGVVAVGASATGAISATGAAIGGVAGGVIGSSVGLATGGEGMAATVPFAAAGAAIGGWAGPALALVGIGTAPAWAVPVAIGGGVVAVCGLATGVYKFARSRDKNTKA